MTDRPFNFNRPLIIGHRGFPALYPENTMVSFEAAVRAGVGMIELDVTLSRDAEVVVIHDDTLDRTTNGSGLVSRHTLAELRELDAGDWFHKKFAGEKLPTLDQVLAAFLDRVKINIEIKASPAREPSYISVVVDKVLTAVGKKDANPRVLISSFDPEVLKTIAAGSKSHPALALLLEEAIGEEALALSEMIGAMSIHPDMDTLDMKTIDDVRDRNLFIFPYNAESEINLRRAFEMGVDGLFVDDPVMAARYQINARTQPSTQIVLEKTLSKTLIP